MYVVQINFENIYGKMLFLLYDSNIQQYVTHDIFSYKEISTASSVRSLNKNYWRNEPSKRSFSKTEHYNQGKNQ